MELKEFLSISGKPGLYKTIAQTKNGVIIESLIDGKRIQAFASDKVSSLGEISIFTTDDDMPLREVFLKFQSKLGAEKAPDAKSDDKKVKAFFEEAIPEYDKEQVYVSHMRKMLGWYNILIGSGVTDFSEQKEEEVATTEKQEMAVEKEEVKDKSEGKEKAVKKTKATTGQEPKTTKKK